MILSASRLILRRSSASCGGWSKRHAANPYQWSFSTVTPSVRSLLARVLRDFADLALPISVSQGDPTRRSDLKGRTHKLKGSAGVIGATSVMRLAGAAEEALEQCRPVDIVEGILRRLALALTTLREEAQLFSETPPEQIANNTVKSHENIGVRLADIDELRVLLETQNLAAIDKFTVLAASLSEIMGVVRCDRVRDAIDNMDFQLGAELLRQSLSPREVGATAA